MAIKRKRTRKNWIVVLQQQGDPDDGMCCVDTGCVNGFGKRQLVVVSEARLALRYIDVFLRTHGNDNFENYESLIRAFLDYLTEISLEGRSDG